MQILLTEGYEFGITKGLNLISGKVDNLKKLGCDGAADSNLLPTTAAVYR